jgi:hypothetical protein
MSPAAMRIALAAALASLTLGASAPAAVAYPVALPAGASGQVADSPVDPALRGRVFAYIKSDVLPANGKGWHVRCGQADVATYCRARSPRARYARRITVISFGPIMLADQTLSRA